MPGIDYAFIDSVLEQHGYDRTRIIAIMQDIQKQYRYLPREVIVYIGEKLHMTPAKLYGVATFYKNFSLDPKGKYVIKVCDGTACHVRKSADIQQAFYDSTGMTPDVVLTDCEAALEALGELNGKRIREDLVDTIFSRFCVGK
mgnify:CR=1 FL=1